MPRTAADLGEYAIYGVGLLYGAMLNVESVLDRIQWMTREESGSRAQEISDEAARLQSHLARIKEETNEIVRMFYE